MRAAISWVGSVAIVVLSACGSDSSSGGSAGNGANGGNGGNGTTTGGTGTGGGGGTTTGGGGGGTGNDPLVTYGQKYEGGQFHLGPVDWDETQWHNACAPSTKYASAIRQAEGTLLAGLWSGIPNVASYCDACIYVTTAKGKTAMLRVVTYGDTSPNSIDVSPDAYKILDSGEYPRQMSWQFAKCPATGNVTYEFQTGSSEYWTSLWVRNARVPIAKVEVQSQKHGAFAPLTRGGDGTLTDNAGFGKGNFTIRLTGVDGSQVNDTFPWPAAGIAGQSLTGTNFN